MSGLLDALIMGQGFRDKPPVGSQSQGGLAQASMPPNAQAQQNTQGALANESVIENRDLVEQGALPASPQKPKLNLQQWLADNVVEGLPSRQAALKAAEKQFALTYAPTEYSGFDNLMASVGRVSPESLNQGNMGRFFAETGNNAIASRKEYEALERVKAKAVLDEQQQGYKDDLGEAKIALANDPEKHLLSILKGSLSSEANNQAAKLFETMKWKWDVKDHPALLRKLLQESTESLLNPHLATLAASNPVRAETIRKMALGEPLSYPQLPGEAVSGSATVAAKPMGGATDVGTKYGTTDLSKFPVAKPHSFGNDEESFRILSDEINRATSEGRTKDLAELRAIKTDTFPKGVASIVTGSAAKPMPTDDAVRKAAQNFGISYATDEAQRKANEDFLKQSAKEKAETEAAYKKREETRKADIATESKLHAQGEEGKVVGKGIGEARLALEGADDSLKTDKKTIDELINHPAFKSTVGGTWRPGMRFVDGTPEADFAKQHEQLLSKSFLKGYEILKGGGAITEVEGKKATEAINRMSLSMSEVGYKKAAQDYLDAVEAGIKKLKAKAAMAPTESLPTTRRKFNTEKGVWE